MRMLHTICLATSLTLLAGCGPLPIVNYSVPHITASSVKLNAEVKSVSVSVGSKDELTGMLWYTFGPADIALWQTALHEALDRSAVFRDDSRNKISIAVKILQYDTPQLVLDETTTAVAKYDIISRDSGEIIYSTTIKSIGTPPPGPAFVGAVRHRMDIESFNMAVQNNISQFITYLQSLSFPS